MDSEWGTRVLAIGGALAGVAAILSLAYQWYRNRRRPLDEAEVVQGMTLKLATGIQAQLERNQKQLEHSQKQVEHLEEGLDRVTKTLNTALATIALYERTFRDHGIPIPQLPLA